MVVLVRPSIIRRNATINLRSPRPKASGLGLGRAAPVGAFHQGIFCEVKTFRHDRRPQSERHHTLLITQHRRPDTAYRRGSSGAGRTKTKAALRLPIALMSTRHSTASASFSRQGSGTAECSLRSIKHAKRHALTSNIRDCRNDYVAFAGPISAGGGALEKKAGYFLTCRYWRSGSWGAIMPKSGTDTILSRHRTWSACTYRRRRSAMPGPIARDALAGHRCVRAPRKLCQRGKRGIPTKAKD